MTTEFQAIFKAAQALPEGERTLLVERLLETLAADGEEPAEDLSDEDLLAELNRRRQEAITGAVEGIPVGSENDQVDLPGTLPMVRIVIFHPRAAKEYRSAQQWYARRSLMAAQRFQDGVEKVIERLETAAEHGTLFRASFHWMRVKQFPYYLYYEISNPNLVWVYAIAHGRRRPGYWLRRVQP